MKKQLWLSLGQVSLIGFLCAVVAACTLADEPQSNTTSSVHSSPQINIPPETLLPLQIGTTWVYSYMPYDPVPSAPSQTMTATYLLTETVVEVQIKRPQVIAKLQRERRLVWQPPEWEGVDKEGSYFFWYVISGTAIYEPWEASTFASFKPEEAILAYDLPLRVGKSWCPRLVDLKDPTRPRIYNCEASGERRVIAEGVYEMPEGKYGPCYKIIEAYTSGGVMRWFCPGVGVVRASYDHGGTRFGFRKTLMSFTPGSP